MIHHHQQQQSNNQKQHRKRRINNSSSSSNSDNNNHHRINIPITSSSVLFLLLQRSFHIILHPNNIIYRIIVPILSFWFGTIYQSYNNFNHYCDNCYNYYKNINNENTNILFRDQSPLFSTSSSPNKMDTTQTESEYDTIQYHRKSQQQQKGNSKMIYVSKHDFFHTFDLGIPIDHYNRSSSNSMNHGTTISDENHNNNNNNNDNVLLLFYNHQTQTISQQQHDIEQIVIQDSNNNNENDINYNRSSSRRTTQTFIHDNNIENDPSYHTINDDILPNCDVVNVMLTSYNNMNNRQCIAILPQQYESSHILKLKRILNHKKNDPKVIQQEKEQQFITTSNQQQYMYQTIPFTQRYNTGKNDFIIPNLINDTLTYWTILQQYMIHVPNILHDIQSMITHNNMIQQQQQDQEPEDDSNNNNYYMSNTIIVMVCNYGQSELLINFLCHTMYSRTTIDTFLNSLIVFTTDIETTYILKSFGIHYYYNENIFNFIPKEAANQYGDANFVAMMIAKVICVQLVSMLGYNILYQDVDMIWYQHPLHYFDINSNTLNQHDIIFQDDGGRSVRYAPYSANTGFYYIRSNDRTRHLLTSMLMSGDLIMSTHSHQQVMIALLKEHVSLFGLRVKVLSRDMDEFPSGYHFHQRTKVYMKHLFAGAVKPYIFHMSWTKNKYKKVKFLRQMGEWYVNDKCIPPIIPTNGNIVNHVMTDCCYKEPIISCHYRDKPSIRPCKSSPPIDEGASSWW